MPPTAVPPAEARGAAMEAAAELAVVADTLRRLTRFGAQRRALAAKLAGLGWTRRQIAERLGVGERAVRTYLRRGPSMSLRS